MPEDNTRMKMPTLNFEIANPVAKNISKHAIQVYNSLRNNNSDD